jgi:hypothetical protein
MSNYKNFKDCADAAFDLLRSATAYGALIYRGDGDYSFVTFDNQQTQAQEAKQGGVWVEIYRDGEIWRLRPDRPEAYGDVEPFLAQGHGFRVILSR